ncbi:putative Zn-dependent protease [Encephalitozoon cuniculi EcunIII-L]|uniref:Zinc metalloprotease n=1 Tax=Encephalitozoon cuniculi TaxID=6035 RepID=M1K8K0_ENCCN|nr:zinc metalloprotease [Encephalitozoon cuniculi]KMV66194.1 putative Zn-dependent protease [Encephalitozoon cuniculi EcunIII-L]UYI27934.1 CAAX prenyl protease 1-like protein [Encephalitozoon cuniculi]
MCRKIKGAFFLFFLVRLAAVAWEVRFLHLYSRELEKGELWFGPDTCTGKIAAGTESFAKDQLKASNLKLSNISKEIKALVLHAMVILTMLTSKIRKKVGRLSKSLRILNPEITLLLLLTSAITSIEKLCGTKLTLEECICSLKYIEYPLNMVALLFIELPFYICLVMKLFEFLKGKFIIVLYIIFVAGNILNTLWSGHVDKSKLAKVPLEVFPEKLQEMLKSEGLEDSVYRAKSSKEKKNASLIGLGSFKRIEIYGDFTKNVEELYPVSFHEVGHSIDNIILKRKILMHAMVICEVLAFTAIYAKGSKAFGVSDMSSEAFALMVFIMYLALGRALFLTFSNVYAQRSELFADEVARINGYGDGLSQALFDMALEHNTTIDSTYLFNAITSLHPIVRERIDRCGCLS